MNHSIRPPGSTLYVTNRHGANGSINLVMAATLAKYRDAIEEATPLGRIGTPQDVAGACLFLSSRAGAFVSGAVMTLDGGTSIRSHL